MSPTFAPNIPMPGAAAVRAGIASYLAASMPPLLLAVREYYGIPTFMLPDPVRYDAMDPLSVSEYPTVGSLVSSTNNWKRVDINRMGEEVYQATYQVRIFTWVRTPCDENGKWAEPEYDTAMQARDHMLAVMRSCLLSVPSLGSEGRLRMQENTLSEDYLDAIKSNDQSNRWMAGGVISCAVESQEENHLAAIGVANTVRVEGETLP